MQSGTHNQQHCLRKQRMLHTVINERAAHETGAGETPCVYAPTSPAALPPLPANWKPHSYCHPHEDHAGTKQG